MIKFSEKVFRIVYLVLLALCYVLFKKRAAPYETELASFEIAALFTRLNVEKARQFQN